MPVKRQTTNRDIRRLRELAKAGVTRAEAANELNMSKESVRYWDLKLQFGFTVINRPCRRATAKDLAKLCAITADGDAPIRAVARELGMWPSSVRFWGRRLGLNFPEQTGFDRLGVISTAAIQRAVLVQ